MPSVSSSRLSLQGLPAELQQQIITYLTASNDLNSIHSLLLTCKHLYDIVLPFSVQTYSNTPRSPRLEGPQPRNRTLQFLRYIVLIKPDLARHVHTLDLGSWSHEPDNNNKSLRVKPDERSLYKAILNKKLPSGRYNPLFLSEWSKALNQGVEDASIALLLVVCPNIRTLIYTQPEDPGFFKRFLTRVIADRTTGAYGSTNTFLSRLQCVKQLSDGWNCISFGPEELRAWPFFLPDIITYKASGLSIQDHCCEAVDQIPRRSSRIQSLTMIDSRLWPSVFHSIIGACQSLRKFHYTHQSLGDPTEVTPRDVIAALLTHAASLEDLQVTSSYCLYRWSKYALSAEPAWTYMGIQLRQMNNLKSLTLVMEALTGIHNLEEGYPRDVFKTPAAPPIAECIPEELRYLEIQGCGREDLDRLTDFVGTVLSGDRLSQLRSVKFFFGSSRVEEEELKKLCVNTAKLTVKATKW